MEAIDDVPAPRGRVAERVLGTAPGASRIDPSATTALPSTSPSGPARIGSIRASKPRCVPLSSREPNVNERAPESTAADRDSEIAARARDGDRTAFAELYARYAGTIHGVLLAMVPRDEARDLVQDVFLLALRAIGELDDPRRIGPWLCAIARNRARDALKSHAAGAERREDLETVAALDPDESGEEEEARRVLAAIRALPECYREPLVLRLVEGSSGAEIAARTGLTAGSVRINLHRGMKLLRARLARTHRE